MHSFCTEIHGHVVELRLGTFGGEEVLVDGRPVSSRPFAGMAPKPHRFEIEDEEGSARFVEVTRFDASKLGMGRYRVRVSVDGRERCRLEPIDLTRPPGTCANCGYLLTGQPVEHGEVRCPECGRHVAAALMPRDDAGAGGATPS